MATVDRSTRNTPWIFARPVIVGLLVVALAGCAAAASSNPAAPSAATASKPAVSSAGPSITATSTPSTTAATSAPSGAPAAGGGTAAAWCAFVIEINTKYGYMKDKNYTATPPSLDVERQLVTEALSRLDEWVAKSPPEIKDATAAEIAWFQRVKAYGDVHGWTDAAGFPQATATENALIASLVPYQQKECGITFGK